MEDITLEVDDLINMFKKAELLGDGQKNRPLQLSDLIASVEKFYAPETKLEAKLTQEQFNIYYRGVLAQQAKEQQLKLQ